MSNATLLHLTPPLIQKVIDAARDQWGLGNASITLLAARENRVFRIERTVGLAALRLHRPGYRNIEEIHAELQWMQMLADNGLCVPKPIAAIDRTQIATLEGVVVDMLSWVDGTPLSQTKLTEAIYHQLGQTLARMHNLADAWHPPASFSRPTWNLVGSQPSWGQFWKNPLLSRTEKTLLEKFRDTARQALNVQRQPDYGLIHADLVPDNVLHNGHQLQIIDFDDGGYGYRLFDLATITHRSKRLHADNTLANATVAGYCEHRALDLEILPLFEAMRACSYVGWNISRMNEPGAKARNTRFIDEALAAVNLFLNKL